MTPRAGHTDVNIDNSGWISTEVESLQSQMAMLQSALESSKHAVAEFHRRAAQNLEASELRYQELFDNVVTGIYRMAEDGHLMIANPALVRMLGYDSFDELASKKLSPPWRLLTASQSGQIIGFERTWKKKDGEAITVRESCRAVRDGSRLRYYEGVVEDITSQKKAETFEHDCRALLEFVARNERLERIANQVVRLLERQLVGANCVLLLAHGDRLSPAVAMNLPGKFFAALQDRLSVSDDTEFFGRAAFRNKAEIAEDIREHPAWQEHLALAERYELRSCWTMPIVSGRGAILGAIAVCRKEPHSPDFAEIQMVETTSRLAGLAVEHRQLYDDLERQAMRDRLTDLPNRTYFEEVLAVAIERSETAGRKLALLWIDLDRFKEINDTLGHHIGDLLIRNVALRLQPALQGRAICARIGGDEFAVLIPDFECTHDVEEYARRLMEYLRTPFQINGCEIFVTASVGIALYPEHGRTPTELQQNADATMYQVKSHGRDGIGFYESALGDGIRERVELANHLRRAVERNELELHFQPQVELDGKLRGFEALLRWRHPVKGVLMPGHFIDIAEETGLIVPIGAWVLEEACRQCAKWNALRREPVKMAVNVSALQFYFSDLFEVVQTALANSGLDATCLELELTESLVMRDAQQSTTELQKLRSLGITIAIDDFGTGYSSLSYLQQLPVDVLKIDRSFLEHIDSSSASAVVQAITALAHALRLQVVAEGIETERQLMALRQLGVDLAQGYLIGRPAPAHEMAVLIDDSESLPLTA